MAIVKHRKSATHRYTTLIIFLVFAIAALYLFINGWKLEEYWRYFAEDRMPITFDYDSLSENWTEKSLYERFGHFPIQCRTYIGGLPVERACGIDVKSHNGVPALYLAFFFKQDRLQFLSVNIPRWSLRKAKESLRHRFGNPYAGQLLKYNGVRLAAWKMSNGSAVFLNMEEPPGPLSWNSVLWISASQCEASKCFAEDGFTAFVKRFFGPK